MFAVPNWDGDNKSENLILRTTNDSSLKKSSDETDPDHKLLKKKIRTPRRAMDCSNECGSSSTDFVCTGTKRKANDEKSHSRRNFSKDREDDTISYRSDTSKSYHEEYKDNSNAYPGKASKNENENLRRKKKRKIIVNQFENLGTAKEFEKDITSILKKGEQLQSGKDVNDSQMNTYGAEKLSNVEKNNVRLPIHDSFGKGEKSAHTKHSDKYKNKLKDKLDGAQFRWINEQLYTTESQNAYLLFQRNESLFDVYHRGFQAQVKSWPENPVDIIINQIKNSSKSIVIADLGCGEAKLAQNVEQKVHSFDLVAKNEFVTACDMAMLPLDSRSVDVAVYCLSLMGTNLTDFLKEAHRILKPRGTLKITEVASRVDDLHHLIEAISCLGFKLISKNTTNRMFVLMDFQKVDLAEKAHKTAIKLKPCIYKKR